MKESLFSVSKVVSLVNCRFESIKKLILFFVALLYVITAYNSMGMYYADEHFQIVEFANYRLGVNSLNDMAWEYDAKIRPSIQPVVCYFLIKLFGFFSIKNPYTISFGFRLLTGFLSLMAIVYFIKKTEFQFTKKKDKLLYYLISCFLCFLAFLNVRFSSEAWSSLFMVFAVGLILSNKEKNLNLYFIGLLFGFAFLFRFQTVFSFIGILVWCILIMKMKWTELIKLIGVFGIILILGTLLDFWFYGSFVITPYNYFYKNIIEGVASNYGIEPWYFYIETMIMKPIVFIGLPITVSLIYFFIKYPRHIITWVVFPFILMHSLVGHKEYRFLFPLANFVPFVIMVAIHKNEIKFRKGSLKSLIIGLVVVVNTLMLIVYSLKPAGAGRLIPSKYLYENYQDEEILLVHEKEDFAFTHEKWGFSMKFYEQKNIETKSLQSLDSLTSAISESQKIIFLLVSKENLDNAGENIDEDNWELVQESMPLKLRWIRMFEDYGLNIPRTGEFLLLYKLKKK